MVKVILVFPKSVNPSVVSCASEWRVSTTQDPLGEGVLPGTVSARITGIRRITPVADRAVCLDISFFLLVITDLRQHRTSRVLSLSKKHYQTLRVTSTAANRYVLIKCFVSAV